MVEVKTRASITSLAAALAAGLWILASPATAAQGLEVDTLKEWCSADPKSQQELRIACILYLRGLVEGAVQQAANSGGKLFFCPTDQRNLTFGDAPEFFVKYVTEHPASERTDNSAIAWARAVAAHMPCKR